MIRWQMIRECWKALFMRARLERDMDDEIAHFLDMSIERQIRRGVSPDEARRNAYREFGGVERTREQVREQRGLHWLTELFRDIRFSLRSLCRRPGFTITFLLSLAVGIGGVTSIYSLVDAVLLRPLPFEDPDRILAVWEVPPTGGRNIVSTGAFSAWSEEVPSFESLAASSWANLSFSAPGELPQRVKGARVSPSLFPLLGIAPLLGRTFNLEEAVPGRDRVVVLSHQLWESRFGSDPGILGKAVTVDGDSREVVGVMPPIFLFTTMGSLPERAWVPLALSPEEHSYEIHSLRVVARLREGVTLQQANEELTHCAAASARAHSEELEGWSAYAEPFRNATLGEKTTMSLALLLGAVFLLLFLTCANLANLLLARSTGREQEMAIRCFVGAGRARLVRQLMAENLLLAGLGGSLSIVIAFVFVHGFPTFFPRIFLPAAATLKVDGRVLAFAGAITVFSSFLFGLAPALQASRSGFISNLRVAGSSLQSGGKRRRSVLVITQLAMATAIFLCAGLLGRSLLFLRETDVGCDANNLLTLTLDLPAEIYEYPSDIIQFHQEVLQRLEGLPGVQSAGFSTTVPLQGSFFGPIVEVEETGELFGMDLQMATAGYMETAGIRLDRGRLLNEDDELGPPVAVVNDVLARSIFPGEDALGKRIRTQTLNPDGSEGHWVSWEIVGVFQYVKLQGLTETTQYRQAYVPHTHAVWTHTSLAVRGETNERGLRRAIQEAIWQIDPALSLGPVRTMDEIIMDAGADTAFRYHLFASFAALALLIAGLGVYGIVAFTVAKRIPEFGLRLALGATPFCVRMMVLRWILLTAVVGVGVGLVGGLVFSHLMKSLLFGIQPTDPATFLLTGFTLTATALLAGHLPSARAMKVDPIEAIRST